MTFDTVTFTNTSQLYFDVSPSASRPGSSGLCRFLEACNPQQLTRKETLMKIKIEYKICYGCNC